MTDLETMRLVNKINRFGDYTKYELVNEILLLEEEIEKMRAELQSTAREREEMRGRLLAHGFCA